MTTAVTTTRAVLENCKTTLEALTPKNRTEWTFRRVPEGETLDSMIKSKVTTGIVRRFEVAEGASRPGNVFGTGKTLLVKDISVTVAYMDTQPQEMNVLIAEDGDSIITALCNIASLYDGLSLRRFKGAEKPQRRMASKMGTVITRSYNFECQYYVNYGG